MNRQLWAVLAFASVLQACAFQTREVPASCQANDGLGPCAAGETCFVEEGVVQCQCGVTLVEGGPACSDQQTCANSERCNTPPVPQIGDGNAVIEVGADAEVVLSSAGSYDPDGDSLQFSWFIDGACVFDEVASAEADLHFAVLEPGSKCIVSLTADDGLATTTVDAEVVAIATGAYVWASDPTCKRVEADGFTNNGLPATPWCTIGDGLAAAMQYGIAEVLVAADDYSEPGLVVPANTAIIGGLAPSNGWIGTDFSRLLLEDPGRVVDPRGVLLAGDGAELVGFSVERAVACTADCALVTIEAVSANIDRCSVGTGFVTGAHGSAPGFQHVGIDVLSSDRSIYVDIYDTDVGIAEEAAEAIGIRLDGQRGELRGRLQYIDANSSSVSASGQSANRIIGIWTRETTDVSVVNSSSFAIGNDAEIAIALVDGMANSIMPDACSDREFCRNSTGLMVGESSFHAETSQPAGYAMGIALLGTEQAYVGVDPVSGFGFSVGANAPATAVGLLTVGTDQLAFDGGQVDQTYVFASVWAPEPGTPNVAVAWVDGWNGHAPTENAPLTLGSSGLDIRNATLRSSGEGAGTELLAAALLIGTDGAVLDNLALDPVIYSGRPRAAASLWTVATRDVEVSGANVGGPSRYETIATDLAAAVVDGFLSPINGPRPDLGSQRLTIERSIWNRSLGVESPAGPASRAACMLLVGTNGGSWLGSPNVADGNIIDCGDWQSSTASSFAQVWTIATSEVGIIGNQIGPLDVALGGAIRSSPTWYGIRDGDTAAEAAHSVSYGSSALNVNANRITAPIDAIAYDATALHIERGGADQDGAVWLKSNAIRNIASDIDIGIRVGNAPVEVVNNTVYVGWCDAGASNCSGSVPVHSIALLVGSALHDVEVANNILTTGPAQTRTLMIDRGGSYATGALNLSVEAFAQNLLVPPSDTAPQAFSFLCLGGGGGGGVDVGNAHCYGSVGGGASGGLMTDAMQELADDGDLFVSLIDTPTFCWDDMHIEELQPVAGAAHDAFSVGTDIDGEPRTTPHDIGADELGSVAGCP